MCWQAYAKIELFQDKILDSAPDYSRKHRILKLCFSCTSNKLFVSQTRRNSNENNQSTMHWRKRSQRISLRDRTTDVADDRGRHEVIVLMKVEDETVKAKEFRCVGV